MLSKWIYAIKRVLAPISDQDCTVTKQIWLSIEIIQWKIASKGQYLFLRGRTTRAINLSLQLRASQSQVLPVLNSIAYTGWYYEYLRSTRRSRDKIRNKGYKSMKGCVIEFHPRDLLLVIEFIQMLKQKGCVLTS